MLLSKGYLVQDRFAPFLAHFYLKIHGYVGVFMHRQRYLCKDSPFDSGNEINVLK
jgi:hypothetical protein